MPEVAAILDIVTLLVSTASTPTTKSLTVAGSPDVAPVEKLLPVPPANPELNRAPVVSMPLYSLSSNVHRLFVTVHASAPEREPES